MPVTVLPQPARTEPPTRTVRRTGFRAICLLAGFVCVLLTAGCEQVRKQLEDPAPPPPTEVTPAPTEDAGDRSAPAAEPAPGAHPGPDAGAVLPGPGRAAAPQIQLTPPPGVVPATRVALLLPLSGETAPLGEALLNAAQLALFSLAGESFALMPIDTQGTPDGAAAAARTAVADGARLVLGPLFASSVSAVAPVLAEAGIQTVAFSNDRSVAGGGIYVMGITPEQQIRRVVDYATGRGVRRIAAILPEGAFGRRVADALYASARERAVTVGEVARYATTDTEVLTPIVRRLADYDARRQALVQRRKELESNTDEASKLALQRLEGLDTLGDVPFDAVLLPEGGTALRNLAPLLRFYDVDPRKVRILGTMQWLDPVFATEPSLFGGWFPAPAPAARRPFQQLYEKTYGESPPGLASLAYDATAMAAVVARAHAEREADAGALSAGTRRAPLPDNPFTVDALTAPRGFAGVDGIFRLRPSGEVERKLAVMEVRDRRFVLVSPAAKTFRKATGKAATRAPTN